MYNTGFYRFKEFNDGNGRLTPIEGGQDIPFKIKRIYYITDVQNDARRGYHSHKNLHQVLICLSGSVKILLKTPHEEKIVELSNTCEGLYIGPMIWREMFDFASDAVLLVLASEQYNEDDYIRDFTKYREEFNKYYGMRQNYENTLFNC